MKLNEIINSGVLVSDDIKSVINYVCNTKEDYVFNRKINGYTYKFNVVYDDAYINLNVSKALEFNGKILNFKKCYMCVYKIVDDNECVLDHSIFYLTIDSLSDKNVNSGLFFCNMDGYGPVNIDYINKIYDIQNRNFVGMRLNYVNDKINIISDNSGLVCTIKEDNGSLEYQYMKILSYTDEEKIAINYIKDNIPETIEINVD